MLKSGAELAIMRAAIGHARLSTSAYAETMLRWMRKRKLFGHVDLAKTDSTSIQSVLHRLSPSIEQLTVHALASAGVRGNHRQFVSRQVPVDLRRANFLEHRWQALFNEVARCRAPRLVVTAEHFSSPWDNVPSVKRFSALAEAANLSIDLVACVRP